jgi:hypothetical protein
VIKKTYSEKRTTFRRQLVRYRLTGQKGGRKEKNNARSRSMAFPTAPSMALPNRELKYKNLQGAIKKPLEALYWQLQRIPHHGALLKVCVMKNGFSQFRIPEYMEMSNKIR